MQKAYFAQDVDELPSRDRTLSMSGLAFMQAILDGEVTNPPIGETLGFELDAVEDGRVVFRGKPSFESLNPVGTVHGGWYGTILDSAMACAVMTKVPRGSLYTTLEYKVNITRAIPIGTEVLAEGIVSHSGRTTGVAEGTIRDAASGKLYATGSTTCLIMQVSITAGT
ncbi:PaaI family thioesterase [Gymnodinialimonas ceratoperidinii]|uniref:PaaI family thioesterase n=1 Tax=Gymnodinialimonas ceratoperidinii TaxID=2856823 RepID=A0A8F6TWZ9_9RHOB|nr:PaaI family thioesterase [Gymnodinialimonas ceratoperidinii]QXT39287.1 PaaI family thioesterase [Gymnodinialimonas ceratoperidinii]